MGKQKICMTCNQSFSQRYYRRHVCIDNDEVEGSNTSAEEQSSTYGTNGFENHQSVNLNSSEEDEYYMSKETLEKHFKLILKHKKQDKHVREEQNISDSETTFTSSSSITSDEYIDDSESDKESKSSRENKFSVLGEWIISFLVIWQSLFYISDAALLILLTFIKKVLLLLGAKTTSEYIPKTIYSLKKQLNILKDPFTKYVMCPKCYSLYDYNTCIVIIEGKVKSKTCWFIQYPHHRQRHMRKQCGELLLKEVIHSQSNQKILIPRKEYCYYSLKNSLGKLLQRQDFETNCNKWKTRQYDPNILSDVYDGSVWKEFADPERRNFLCQDNTFGSMLNLDWFQPFKHVQYSVGVIYMVFLNLPREERFKHENVILVGILPHCSTEPKTNTFLRPLVDELKEAWEPGLLLHSTMYNAEVKVRVALLCVGCDVPACRKLCGFLGHNATQGCHKCSKSFPGILGEKNYGGFSRESWQPREYLNHVKQIKEIKSATSKGDKEKLESKYGTRYSVLVDLPYFDPIRFSVVDPMHNLFLGSARTVISVWKARNIIDTKLFKSIQDKVDSIVCPSDIGKIPRKIESGFDSFTANQWKNWTLQFSMYALKDILPEEDLKCWQSFVLAAKILCSKSISLQYIETADQCLLKFCRKFEELYGSNSVTPNMHLHGHLSDCLLDYCPIYSFWLYSFERENGILGSYPVNRKNIEVHLMRRFLRQMTATDARLPGIYSDTLVPLFQQLLEKKSTGTLLEINYNPSLDSIKLVGRQTMVGSQNIDWTIEESHIQFPYRSRKYFSPFEMVDLKQLYSFLYPSLGDSIYTIPSTYIKMKEVYYLGSIYGSCKSRSKRSACIQAYWLDEKGSLDPCNQLTASVGEVEFYSLHHVIIDGIRKPHCFAKVKWYKSLADNIRNYIGKPVEVFSTQTEPKGVSSFIPLQRIKSKCVNTKMKIRSRDVMVICTRDHYHI